MGYWVDAMGPRASQPIGYRWPFATLGLLMWLAACSTPIIHSLGAATGRQPISPAEEISPATMEGVW
jgi:hypothetical protein